MNANDTDEEDMKHWGFLGCLDALKPQAFPIATTCDGGEG